MSMYLRTEGIEQATKRISKSLKWEGTNLAFKGLIRGAIDILADAQNNAPRDTGNLMGSAYIITHKDRGSVKTHRHPSTTRASPEEKNAINQNVEESKGDLMGISPPSVLIGFGASYAIFVHEGDPGWDWHDGGPQYLVRALNDNESKVVQRVREEMKRI